MTDQPRDAGAARDASLDAEALIPILDGASPQVTQLPPDLDAEVRIARNRDRPMDDRLEAFENVSESEVGDTRLQRARNIERETGLRQIYLKFDGEGPNRIRAGDGCHAARI